MKWVNLQIILLVIVFTACSVEQGTTPPSANDSQTEESGDGLPASAETPEKSELSICALERPSTFYGTSDPVAQAIFELVSPGYAVYGADYRAEPGILLKLPSEEAGTLQRNEDGTYSLTYHFREDLVWSDGTPFDTRSAFQGLTLSSDPTAPTFNVLDVQVGDVALFVTADYDTEYPYVPSQPLVPAHVLGDSVTEADLSANGYIDLLKTTIGPYFLAEESADGALVFQANPYFPESDSLISVVIVRFAGDAESLIKSLDAGDCDLVLDNTLTLEEWNAITDPNQVLLSWNGKFSERIILNTYVDPFSERIPYFADPAVRQAVIYAIDRSALANNLTYGLTPALESWIAPEHWAYAGGSAYPFDRGSAETLLNNAGWTDSNADGTRDYAGEGGEYTCQRGFWDIESETPLTPTLLIPANDPLREQMALTIQTDLAQVGINLQIEAVEPARLFAPDGPIVRREFDMLLLSAVQHPDPTGSNQWVGADVYRHPLEQTVVHRWELADRWLTSEQLVETLAYNNTPSPFNDYQGQNYSGWCNELADIAIVQANLPTGIEERIPFYSEHQALFGQDVPVIPLFMRLRTAVYQGELCGVDPIPFEPLTWNIADWYFDETGACD